MRVEGGPFCLHVPIAGAIRVARGSLVSASLVRRSQGGTCDLGYWVLVEEFSLSHHHQRHLK